MSNTAIIPCRGCECCNKGYYFPTPHVTTKCNVCDCCVNGVQIVYYQQCRGCDNIFDECEQQNQQIICEDCAKEGIGYPQDEHLYAYYYNCKQWLPIKYRYKCYKCKEVTDEIAELNGIMTCINCAPSNYNLLYTTRASGLDEEIVRYVKWDSDDSHKLISKIERFGDNSDYYIPCSIKSARK